MHNYGPRAVRLLDFPKAVIHIINTHDGTVRARPRIPLARSGRPVTTRGWAVLLCRAGPSFSPSDMRESRALRCPRGTPGTSKMYKKHSALIVLSTFHYPASPSGPDEIATVRENQSPTIRLLNAWWGDSGFPFPYWQFGKPFFHPL